METNALIVIGCAMLAVGGAEHIELTTPEGEVRWTLTGHGEPLQDSGRHLIQDLVFSADGELLEQCGVAGDVLQPRGHRAGAVVYGKRRTGVARNRWRRLK